MDCKAEFRLIKARTDLLPPPPVVGLCVPSSHLLLRFPSPLEFTKVHSKMTQATIARELHVLKKVLGVLTLCFAMGADEQQNLWIILL